MEIVLQNFYKDAIKRLDENLENALAISAEAKKEMANILVALGTEGRVIRMDKDSPLVQDYAFVCYAQDRIG